MKTEQEEREHCCSDCDCPETCTKTGCVGMSTERERCEAVARAADFHHGCSVQSVADLLLRERAAAREEARAGLVEMHAEHVDAQQVMLDSGMPGYLVLLAIAKTFRSKDWLKVLKESRHG